MRATNYLTALRIAAGALQTAYETAQEDNEVSKAYAERLAREALTHTVDAIGMLSGRENRAAETLPPALRPALAAPDHDAHVFRCETCKRTQRECTCGETCDRCGVKAIARIAGTRNPALVHSFCGACAEYLVGVPEGQREFRDLFDLPPCEVCHAVSVVGFRGKPRCAEHAAYVHAKPCKECGGHGPHADGKGHAYREGP